MSKYGVTPEKERALEERMANLAVHESDLEEKFILGSGKGGQKINKTASCVYLKHTPSGIEVKCQKARAQSLNRYYARVAVCNKIEEKETGIKSTKQMQIEKIRRQKRKRSRRSKEKMLAQKHQRSEVKKGRKKVSSEENGN